MDLNSDDEGSNTDEYGKNDDECVVLEVNAAGGHKKRRRKRLTPYPKGHKSASRRPGASASAAVTNPPATYQSGLALLTAAAATAAPVLRNVNQPEVEAPKAAMPPKTAAPPGRGRPRKQAQPDGKRRRPIDKLCESDDAASNTESEHEGDNPEVRRQRRTIKRNRACIKDPNEQRRFDQLSVVNQLTYRPTRDRTWKGLPRFNIATMQGKRGNLHRSYDQKHSEDANEAEGLQIVRDEFGGSPQSTSSWHDTDDDHEEEPKQKNPKRDTSSKSSLRRNAIANALASVLPPPRPPSPVSGPAPHLLDADNGAGPSDADSFMDVFEGQAPPFAHTPTENSPVDVQTTVCNAPPGENIATPKIAYARWRKYTAAPQRIDNLQSQANVVIGAPVAISTSTPVRAPLPHPNLDEIIRGPPPPPVQRSSSITRTTTTTKTTTTTNRPLSLNWQTKSSLELAEAARRELEAQARRATAKPPRYFDPKFKSDKPCRYGSDCKYRDKGCAFVHPGDECKRKLEDNGSSSSSFHVRRVPMQPAKDEKHTVNKYVWRPPLENNGFTRHTFRWANKVERDSNGKRLKPFHELDIF